MAKIKRRRRRRYRGNYHPYIKASAPAVGYMAWKVANKVVKKYVNVEKGHHTTGTSSSPDSAGTVIGLTLIDQGDDYNKRTGRQIKVTSLALRFIVNQHASATETQTRIMLVRDREQDGVIPTVTGATGVLSSANVQAFPYYDNMRRFTILYDKVITHSSNGSQSTFRKYYKKMALKVRYDGTTASQAHQKENNLYLLLISNEATNTPTVNWESKIRYIDN